MEPAVRVVNVGVTRPVRPRRVGEGRGDDRAIRGHAAQDWPGAHGVFGDPSGVLAPVTAS